MVSAIIIYLFHGLAKLFHFLLGQHIGWGDNGVKSKITLTTPLNMFLLPKHSQGIFKKNSSGVGNALPPPLEDLAPPRPL